MCCHLRCRETTEGTIVSEVSITKDIDYCLTMQLHVTCENRYIACLHYLYLIEPRDAKRRGSRWRVKSTQATFLEPPRSRAPCAWLWGKLDWTGPGRTRTRRKSARVLAWHISSHLHPPSIDSPSLPSPLQYLPSSLLSSYTIPPSLI